MTQQEYSDSIAIFHPAGGNRAGIIHNIKDTNVQNFNLLRTNSEENLSFDSAGTVALDPVYDVPSWSDDHFQVYRATPNTTNQEHYRRTPSVGLTYFTGNPYVSYYAKSEGVNIVGISTSTTPTGNPRFDVLNKTVVSTSNSTDHLIEDVGNGWVRISYKSTVPLSGYCHIGFYSPSDQGTWASNGTDSILISGLMISESPTLVDYYPSGGFRDLQVVGGGGTRFLSDGSLEELEYYNILSNSNDITQTTWSKENVTAVNRGNSEFLITDDTDSGQHYVTFPTNQLVTISAEFKYVDWQYCYFSIGIGSNVNKAIKIDLINQTCENLSPTILSYTSEITTDGWIKVEAYVSEASMYYDNFTVAFRDTDYGGSGSSIRFRKPMVMDGNQLNQNTPYQVNVGSAAFPKIDYSTGAPTFLIEPQRTNLIANSNNLESINWSQEVGVNSTGYSANSPENKQNASELLYTGGDYARHSFDENVTVGQNYVFSLFVKPNGYNYFMIRSSINRTDGTYSNIGFDLINKTVTFEATGYTGKITEVANGFLWISIIVNATDISSRTYFRFQNTQITDNSISTLPSDDGTKGGYVWGVNFIQSDILENPIISKGTTVTRTEGKIATQSISEFTSGQSIFLYGDISDVTEPVAGMLPAIAIDDTTSTNRVELGFLKERGYVYAEDSSGLLVGSLDNITSGLVKICAVYDSSGIRGYINGVEVLNTTKLPVGLTTLRSNDTTSAGGYRGGRWRMKEFRRINKTLTSQEAITLTTV